MVQSPRFHFMKYRYVAAFASLSLLGIGVFGYVNHGGFRYSVDFNGGTQVLAKFSKSVGSESLKSALAHSGFEDVTTREFSDVESVIRVKEFSNDVQGLGTRIKDAIETNLSEVKVDILEVNAVGPATGATLRLNFILMLSLGLAAMFAYIAFRFWSFSYGAGAVVALLHDPLCILAVFAFLNKEISPNVICAIIATLGYSINDTIVIFARIRENFIKEKGMPASDLVDLSLNQTLRRTLLTSFATALCVASQLFFGGESLRNLSLALLIGIVVGTYSSIYVASPVMLFFRGRKTT